LSTLGSDGKWPSTEIDYTAGCPAQRANWPATEHCIRIQTLSAAYHGGLPNASQYVGDQNLRASITLAMDWWFSNDYTNVACRDQGGSASCPCGTPGLWNTNWFPNVIGVPGNMMRSCLLLNDTLTATQLSNCTNFGSRAYGTFGRVVNGLGFLTGANTLDVASIGIDLGLLTGNVSLIDNAYRRVHNEVVVQQAVKADGIRPDGSFGQHAGVIYNGNYGEDYTDDVLALELEAAGTQYEATGTSKNEFATLIDGDQWMIYRNVLTGVLHWDLSVAGRFISAPVADGAAIASVHLNLTDIRQLGTQWGSDTLTEVAERLSRDSTTANAGSLDGNRVFYNNDYMVQRGRKYVKTLRTYSNRTLNTECVNTQNPFGFHLSDGTVYTYLKGNEYEDIFAAWDWNLIPGITVDYNVTTLNCQTTLWTGLESFVGGVSDSRIGVGAVRYTNPFTRSLSWKKVWFFLENDVQHVMINSISSTTNASIFSVLDQRRHEGEIRVNGQYVTSGNYTIVGSLWHANVGYKFSTDGEDACDTWSDGELQLSISVGNRTGNWSSLGVSRQPPTSVDLFAAWLYHKDLSQSVSYTVFPGLPYGEFLDRAQSTDLEDVQNDGNVSAVWDATHRTIGIVFWNDGGGEITFPDVLHTTSLSVKADRGLAVIIAMKSRTITVADPSQTSIDAQVDLTWGDGPESLRWGTSRVKVFTFLLPTGGSAGKSVTIDMW
ncbi:polysaccharide lyase family 8 protein, partial [Rickenella mellea]